MLQDPMNVARTIRFVLTLPEEAVIPEVMIVPMRETSWPWGGCDAERPIRSGTALAGDAGVNAILRTAVPPSCARAPVITLDRNIERP